MDYNKQRNLNVKGNIFNHYSFCVYLSNGCTKNKPIVCEETSAVLTTLFSGDYQEFPIWIGIGENSRYSLFANEKTKSWTLIQYDEKIACVLGVGTQYRMVFNGPSI